jgi:hypothetical protein
MKWMLVTNFGNPGDEFARIGVETLIKSVDPKASFFCVRRDHGDEITRDFYADRVVVCSMPGLWAHAEKETGEENSTRTHHTWGIYNRWIDKGIPVIFAGMGSCFGYESYPDKLLTKNGADVFRDVKEKLVNRAASFYARSPLLNKLLGGCNVSPCPSIFVPKTCPDRLKDLQICNIMPGGAHYAFLGQGQYKEWEAKRTELSEVLHNAGFHFVAHSWPEWGFARASGWPEERISFCYQSTGSFLDVYSRAAVYVGNRVHGSIVSRSFGAPAVCIGYDTRLEAAKLAGARVVTPEELRPKEVVEWALSAVTPRLDISGLFEHQRQFFK